MSKSSETLFDLPDLFEEDCLSNWCTSSSSPEESKEFPVSTSLKKIKGSSFKMEIFSLFWLFLSWVMSSKNGLEADTSFQNGFVAVEAL